MNKEKDKTLEEFFEALLMGIWAIIQFSIAPVKSKSNIGSIFENLIRSFLFFGLLALCLWIYCFVHEKKTLFNNWNLFYLFLGSAFLFTLRWFFSKRDRKTNVKTEKITTKNLRFKKLNF